MERTLGNIEGRVELIYELMTRMEASVAKHDTRLDALEKTDAHRVGWLAGAASIGSLISLVIVKLLSKVI